MWCLFDSLHWCAGCHFGAFASAFEHWYVANCADLLLVCSCHSGLLVVLLVARVYVVTVSFDLLLDGVDGHGALRGCGRKDKGGDLARPP